MRKQSTLHEGKVVFMEKIEHQRSGHRGAFVMLRDGEKLAEQTYTVPARA